MADRAESEDPAINAEYAAARTRFFFISYASRDAEIAQKACSALEAAGFTCWIAPRDVKPGHQYADAIIGAINEAQALVMVLSASAVASSHVGREVERAASKHKQIIALRIDTAPLNRALEYFLGESQWIDVPALGMSAALAKLTAAIRREPGTSSPAISANNRPVRTASSRNRLVRAALAVIGVGVLAVLGLHFGQSRFGATQAPVVAAPTGASASPTSGTSISDKSIAVLPFVDMSERKDQEYFADGMAEEILDLLSKIPGLRVIGRTSSFHFKGRNEDLRTVGRELGAAYVLEGSVRKAGDHVRVTAQLIDASSGLHRWSGTYDKAYTDVLELQDEIATAIARELQISLGANDLHPRGTLRNPEAYSTYLRGLHSLDRVDASGFEEAAAYMQQALALDPMLAPAAAKLAYILDLQAEWAIVPAAAGYDAARRAAENALRLDATRALPHAVLAEAHLYRREWAAADTELRQAIALDPRDPDTLMLACYEANAMGRVDEAVRLGNAAVIVDPLSALAHDVLGEAKDSQDRRSEAATEYRRVIELSPTYETVHWELGLVELEQGHIDAALADMQEEPNAGRRDAGLAIVYHALGRKAESNAAVARLEAKAGDTWAYGAALVHAYRGEADQVFSWLDRAYAQYDQVYWVTADPFFDKLHSDPRYAAFLRKLALPK